MTRPFSRILEIVTVKTQKPGSALALCPAHEDRTNASLSVREGADGRALLKCFAGCKTPDIVSALGLVMRDLYPYEGGTSAPIRKPRVSTAALREAYRTAITGILERRPLTERDAPLSTNEKNRARTIAAHSFRDSNIAPVQPEAWESYLPWSHDPLWPTWFKNELSTVMLERWATANADARPGEIDPAGPTTDDHRLAAERAARGLRAYAERVTTQDLRQLCA